MSLNENILTIQIKWLGLQYLVIAYKGLYYITAEPNSSFQFIPVFLLLVVL